MLDGSPSRASLSVICLPPGLASDVTTDSLWTAPAVLGRASVSHLAVIGTLSRSKWASRLSSASGSTESRLNSVCADNLPLRLRSEERRDGTEFVSKWRLRWCPDI